MIGNENKTRSGKNHKNTAKAKKTKQPKLYVYEHLVRHKVGKGGHRTNNSWPKKQGLYRLSYEYVLSDIHRVDKLTEP